MIDPSAPDRPPERRAWYKKSSKKYLHHDLRNSALLRGREIVARLGPDALTLRGLARELGVTHQALLYWFGSRAGLRAAVAEEVTQALTAMVPRATSGSVAQVLRGVAHAWVDYAAKEPNLYRLSTGEGWERASEVGKSWDGTMLRVPPPTRQLRRRAQHMLYRGYVAKEVRGPADSMALIVSSVLHGLAIARVQGATGPAVEDAFDALLDVLAA